MYLNLGFHILDRVGGLDLEGNGLASERLHKDLHPATKPKDKVEGRFLLYVVVRESTAVLQLLAGKD